MNPEMGPDAQALQDLARRYQQHTLVFLRDLVRIHSVNGRDGERGVAQRIVDEASSIGLDAKMIAIDPERPNALVCWGSGPAGFTLIAHTDTVAEGDAAAWSTPPFSAEVRAGRMLGRGAADNKAGIACGLYTLALLRDSGILDPLKVNIKLAGVADEESGASSHLGARLLLDRGLLQARGAIYCYTSDIICIGHRGLLRLTLHAQGKSIHSGSPEWNRNPGSGVNAVTGLADVLLRLESMHLPSPQHPAFPGMDCKITPGTFFSGGEYESIVPAHAEALVDIRLMPGQDAQSVIDGVQAVLEQVMEDRPGLTLQLQVKNRLPGVALDPDEPLVRSAQRWTLAVTGREWPVEGAGPANEGYMLIQAGIPTLCGFGPTGGNAHAVDEWVEVDSLWRTIAMYAGIILDVVRM